MVIGLVLGGMADESLRRALMISDGSFLPMFTRPVCLTLSFFILYFIVSQIDPVKRFTNKLFHRQRALVANATVGEE
jgi:putative tricarboxylic transport membrane protein